MLELLDGDLGGDDPVTVVAANQDDVEERALGLVRERAIRATDAWCLVVAVLALPSLLEPGEDAGFATGDEAQSSVVARPWAYCSCRRTAEGSAPQLSQV